jgi:hypothetical protein
MGGRAYRPGVVRVGDPLVADRASCESERSRGAISYGPRMGRGAVEVLPSGAPRMSRSGSAVEMLHRVGLVRGGPCTRSRCTAFCGGLIVLFFFTVGCGTPILLVPTVAPEPLGECVVTLLEAH